MRHAALLTLGVLVVGVTLAACGSPATPGVATGSTSTTTTTAAGTPSGKGTQTGLLAYSSCMRAHGVTNFPDPTSGGGLNDKAAVVNALEAVSAAIADAAQKDCAHVLPAGEGLGGQIVQPVTAKDQQYYLKAVACMRSHGFPTFPDPVFTGTNVSFAITPSVNTHSAQYANANRICRKLIPAGLPDSGSTG
jgi:hypothetical protein